MDKYEYKIRSEEIKTLIAQEEYSEAAAIADSIDWRRVKSVMMLCTISDLYKINRRLEDSRDLLLLAYERHPGGRSIVYSLCELSIKMEEFVQAVEYYKEFVQVAPKDNGRYVLQYKLYEAQDVSLEERIAVLEELKERDYTEKWAYELAYLYHRVGLGTRCVEECDELILWFGEGKYVWKAMELKMLHESLTAEQQRKYDAAKGIRKAGISRQQPTPLAEYSPETGGAPTQEIPAKELDIQVKLMNVGQYDTINMQKELAENMKELWEGTEAREEIPQSGKDKITNILTAPLLDDTGDMTADADVIGSEEEMAGAEAEEETKVEEVFFGETEDLDTTAAQVMEAIRTESAGEAAGSQEIREIQASMEFAEDGEARVSVAETASSSRPSTFERMLSMEYDGQISLLMPESEQIEKQITGQIKLEDILVEWERMKKDSEQKRMEAVKQRVLEQTGSMFTEFEAAMRDGLLERLESERDARENGQEVEGLETEEAELEEVELEEAQPEEGIDAQEEAEILEEEELAEAEEIDASEACEDGETCQEIDVIEDLEEGDVCQEIDVIEDLEEGDVCQEIDVIEDLEEGDVCQEIDVIEDLEEGDVPQEADVMEDLEEEKESQEIGVIEDMGAGPKEEVEEDGVQEDYVMEDLPKTAPFSGKGKARALSPEEKKLFGSYIQNTTAKEQIIYALDNMSMASYTGNVILTGDEGMDILTLAKNLVREMQMTDRNFSGKVARISGMSLCKKDIGETIEKLSGGALVIHSVCGLDNENTARLHKELNQENRGLLVVIIDRKKRMNRFLEANSFLSECFNIRIDVEALDDDSLVEYGKKYARHKEYSIDEMGVLALHTKISDRQTSDHIVTVEEVKEIVDEAIYHANKKSLSHFLDLLVAKRYDEEDMIILREKDFA